MDKHTILIVEDEAPQREMLVDYFQENDRHTLGAENGMAALEVIEKHPVEIIVSDIKMPKMGGIQLVKKVSEKHPNILIILLTAYGTVESSVEAMKNGASDFLLKPVNLQRLKEAVETGLRRVEMASEEESLAEFMSGGYFYRIPVYRHQLVDSLSSKLGKVLFEKGYVRAGRRNSIITILYEALSNSMYHGSLGVPSKGLRTEEGDEPYWNEISTRAESKKYVDRKIFVSLAMEGNLATFSIQDDGTGFNWRHELAEASKDENAFLRSYGRGLLMLKAMLGDNFRFNDEGNIMTLTFQRGVKDEC